MKLLSTRKTRLSLSVAPHLLLSGGKGAEGKCRFLINGIERKPLVHESGHLLFMDIEDGEHTLEIIGKAFSHKEGKVVVKATENGAKPLNLDIKLGKTEEPEPVAPPKTMIMGLIRDEGKLPLKDVSVTVKNTDRKALTDAEGKFAFEFSDMKTPSETVNLYLYRKGYKAQSPKVTVIQNQSLNAEYILKK